MPSFRQSNFSGGEISPYLYGRGDLAKYASALRRCRDFIPLTSGNLLNRSGTIYQGATKVAADQVRLVPFIYSDTDTYVLEFGNLYIRFWKFGVLLGAPYEVTTTYTTAQLPYLKFSQVGDVLWISNKSGSTRTLTRSGDTSWAIADVSYVPVDPVFIDIDTTNPTSSPSILTSSLSVADATHPEREWRWRVTVIVQDVATGKIFETSAYEVVSQWDGSGTYPTGYSGGPTSVVLYPDKVIEIIRGPTSGLFSDPGWKIISYRYYRGRGTLFGYVGETITRSFVDKGGEPDYTVQPPQGRNPFLDKNLVGATVRTEYPSAVGFFEQRLVLAGTTQKPQWFWLSETGNYTNFDRHIILLEDDSVEFELSSLRREEIRSALGLDRLFLFTSGGVWTVAGVGGPLTAYSIQTVKQTDEGASWLSPLVLRDTIFYVRSKGVGVNALDYDLYSAKYKISDHTILARHLIEGYTIVDWTYAHDPFNVVWAVRSDGKLLSLTYNRTLDVWAWALHDVSGTVESICSVPEGVEDAVYMVVARTINGNTVRYLERLAYRLDADQAMVVFMDCSATYPTTPGVAYDSSTGIFSGLSHLEQRTVGVQADGVVYGTFLVSGGQFTLPTPIAITKARIGLPYYPQAEFLDLSTPAQDVRTLQKTVTQAFLDVESTRGLWVGQSSDDLVEYRNRDVSDSYGAPALLTQQVSVQITSTWNTGGRVWVELRDPVPLNITGISREVVFGGS